MYQLRITLLFITAALFISACGTTKRGSQITKPASADKSRVLETGVASWYGPNFHGKLTANGEIYDMDGITAAHRTLPFGTVLLVENVDNGRTVQVRVNDRGPFAKNRIIDLSRGAAKEVDMIGPGTANVRLYLLEGDLQNSRVTNLKVANYTVQLGSYRNRNQAEKKSAEINGSRVERIQVRNQTVYRVYWGTFQNPDKAEAEMLRLKQMGYAGFVKQIEND